MRSPWILGLAGLVATASADTIIAPKHVPLVAPWSVRTGVKGARDGELLVAPAALEMSELEIAPRLQGPHRIHIGLHYEKTTGDQRYYGAALHVRLDGEPYRVLMESRRPFAEHVFKAAEMAGRRLVLATLSERPAFVDYIRFEPLTPAEFAETETQRKTPHEMDVVGINDVNVWMWLYTTRSEWDFRDTIGQHVHAGFNRVYWMANAGAVFYHTDVGTRYQRDKRGFTPRSGYMVENFRPLEAGVKAAHDMGVEILGWYRLNNNFASKQILEELGPGLNSTFFMGHPEFRLLRANGSPESSKYSFAYPAVRDYVRALCVEMVRKGVDGLMLDLLRHPPLAGYEPPLVDGYMKVHGVDARKVKRSDSAEFARWSAYRARHSFTQFVIELADELKRIGKPVPIGLRCSLAPFAWNRDNGMDVEDLVERGLVKELCLMNGYLSRPNLLHQPHEMAAVGEPYFRLIRGRPVKLICGLHGRGPAETLTHARFAHDAGFDGVAIYESDVYATQPAYVQAYRQLKHRLAVTEPWLTASGATRDCLIPWQAIGAEPCWWQLNLPEPRSLSSLTFQFAGRLTEAHVLVCDKTTGDAWKEAGSHSVCVHGANASANDTPTLP
ncbi:MAG: family 10 glycosylhydrolase, partial [Lentisphaerae bacterium]|nr:family 10 glycosylhydrolase [Lentisphaerota bacterium]